ncbi:MAG: dihydroorotate dehydrogenase electron transfer subunit [Candidatus Riflemargulisbacteria bacterium]
MTKLLEKALIVANAKVADGIYKCRIKTSGIAKACLPGNFINISVGSNSQFLLKRPFGVHNVQGNELEILYRVRGKGTDLMSNLVVGDSIDLLGPLGNEFSLFKGKRILVLGGGMGIAPLFFLEKKLSKDNDVTTLYAVKTRKELAEINVSKLLVHVDEEEGCFACDNLDDVLEKNKTEVLYVCGPDQLMKKSYQKAKAHGVYTEVSLEARMACGFGACVGCVVETVNGLKKVCNEGPVFKAEDVWG